MKSQQLTCFFAVLVGCANALPSTQTTGKNQRLFKREDLNTTEYTYISLSQAVFNAQNRARADPMSFAAELDSFGYSNAADNVRNQDGETFPQFTYDGGLRRAAADVISGSKAEVAARVEKYGDWKVTIGEGAVFGPATPMGVIAYMMKDPANYENIFNPDFLVQGMSCGPDETYGTVCWFVYANQFNRTYFGP